MRRIHLVDIEHKKILREKRIKGVKDERRKKTKKPTHKCEDLWLQKTMEGNQNCRSDPHSDFVVEFLYGARQFKVSDLLIG